MNGKQRMARQSKQWLVDALVTLMKDEAIEDISITELSKRRIYQEELFIVRLKLRMI